MMSRPSLHSLLLLGLLCGLMTSCLEDINLDTGERILNVYCVLKQGSNQELELSYIAPTGGTSSAVREDVVITLFDGNTPVGQFTRVSETKWSLDYTPQEGHAYRLEIEVPGEEMLTAETKYPTACTIRGVSVVRVTDSSTRGIDGIEMDSTEDQFLWCYFEKRKNDPVYTTYIATDHPGVDGRGETIYPFDFDSPVYKGKFENGVGMHYSVGHVLPSDLFGGPVFLHEKVLRIVHPAGFSRPVDRDKWRIFHFEYDDGLVAVEDQSGKTGIFCFGGMDATGSLVICSTSAEYDSYLADFYYVNHDPDDFSALVYKRNHYSNIRNGTGIFGASHEYRMETFGRIFNY